MAEASAQVHDIENPPVNAGIEEAKLVEDLKTEEKRKKMDPKHLVLFKSIEDGDVDTVKSLIESGVSPNISDENDMSPLLLASYRGYTELAEFLISHGADVNMTSHTNFYTPLMMAAISGKLEIAKLLLDSGAKTSAQNSIGKTASDLAGFVGQHEISMFIRNYLTMDRLEPYFVAQGSNPARISKNVALVLQGIVMATNFHPVKVVIVINENKDLLKVENLKKAISTMDDLCRKCVREKGDYDELLALKLHLVSTILSQCKEQLEKDTTKTDLSSFIKVLLKENHSGIKLSCEKLIRQSLTKFPFTEVPLLQYLVKTLAEVNLGENPTAISCIQSVFNGMQASRGNEFWCSACDDRKADLRCSACKEARYCSQRCQKLHWFVHKKKCVKK